MIAKKLHDPRLNYLGSPISSHVVEWTNWLASGAPDGQTGQIYFLRGSISPDPQGNYPANLRIKNPVIVSDSQALLFPIMASTAWEGAFPNLLTDADRLNDVRYDIQFTAELYAKNMDANDADTSVTDR